MVVIGGGVLLVRDEERVDDLMNFFFFPTRVGSGCSEKISPNFFFV